MSPILGNRRNAARPPIVGLTGSIGSGKSLVARILAESGASIIDSDVLARDVVKVGQPAFVAIVDSFGKHVLKPDGEIDRGKLASIVFSDSQKRKELERIVHPEVKKALMAAVEKMLTALPPPSVIVCVIPLLFEAGYDHATLDQIVTVSAPEEVCIQRAMGRDKASRELVLLRLKAQMSQAEKEQKADIVLRNDSDMAALTIRVRELFKTLTGISPGQ